MSVGEWILVSSTVLYVAAGVSFTFFEARPGIGISYLAYGVANVGLLYEVMK